MEKLVPFLMAAIFVAAAFGLLKLALAVSSQLTRQKILASKAGSEEAATALFCSYFGMKNVLSHVVLPVNTSVGRRYTRLDAVVLLPTGLVVVELKDLSGQIENRDDRIWHQSTVTRSGEPREVDFASPFMQNEHHILAVRNVLGKAVSVPIHGLVVFTSPHVSFARKRDDVYTMAGAVDALQTLSSHGRKLTAEERNRVLSVLSTVSRKCSSAWAMQQKKR